VQSGIEGDGGAAISVAYLAIGAFLLVLSIVLFRTVVLYALLLLVPVARLLRWVPGMSALLERLERRAGARDSTSARRE